MAVYVTITCNSCKSDLGYGNALATVYLSHDGREYRDQKLTIPYVEDSEEIEVCKYCKSNDLSKHYDCDD